MFRFGISPQKTATGEKLGVRIGKSLATKAVNGRCLAKNRNFVNQKHEFQEISRYPVDDLSVHFSWNFPVQKLRTGAVEPWKKCKKSATSSEPPTSTVPFNFMQSPVEISGTFNRLGSPLLGISHHFLVDCCYGVNPKHLSKFQCVCVYIYYIVCIMYMCQYVYVYVCMCIYIHTCICTPSTGHGALTSINHSAHDKISKANIVVLW